MQNQVNFLDKLTKNPNLEIILNTPSYLELCKKKCFFFWGGGGGRGACRGAKRERWWSTCK